MQAFERLWEARQVYGPVMLGTDAYANIEDAVRAARLLKAPPPALRMRGNTHILGEEISPLMVSMIDATMRALRV